MAKKKSRGLFDQCANGKHDCAVSYERFYFDHKRGKTILVMTEEFVECGCRCHRKGK